MLGMYFAAVKAIVLPLFPTHLFFVTLLPKWLKKHIRHLIKTTRAHNEHGNGH